jgi:hypothetical protein
VSLQRWQSRVYLKVGPGSVLGYESAGADPHPQLPCESGAGQGIGGRFPTFPTYPHNPTYPHSFTANAGAALHPAANQIDVAPRINGRCQSFFFDYQDAKLAGCAGIPGPFFGGLRSPNLAIWRLRSHFGFVGTGVTNFCKCVTASGSFPARVAPGSNN